MSKRLQQLESAKPLPTDSAHGQRPDFALIDDAQACGNCGYVLKDGLCYVHGEEVCAVGWCESWLTKGKS